MVEGRRITDKGMLDVVTMVYAGLVNKQIVAGLQAAGCNAIGLSGARTVGRRCSVSAASSGSITMLDAGLVVFPAIILLNCNADSVASAVALGAARLAPTDLIYCFEKRGVLRDAEDEGSVIREITAATYPPLKADGTVSKGMIPKIENALRAVEKGVRSVTIRSAERLADDSGTTIR